MTRITRNRTVVQTVPATHLYAVAATLIALLALAVTIFFAQDRLVAIITSLLMAIFWSGGMILLLSKVAKNVAPPLRISPDQLPPKVNIRKVVVPAVALVAVANAGAVALSFSIHEYVPVGIILGLPIVIWDSFRKSKRTERELLGILWNNTGVAWTSKDRSRYLVR